MNFKKTKSFPEGKHLIGSREIKKKIKEGKIKTVIIAKNCPEKLYKDLKDVEVLMFEGDQQELGLKMGKGFPVAMIGIEKGE
jgi:ribosomal protein L30E